MYVRHTVPHSPVATIEHHSLYRAKTGTARVSQHHDKCTIGYLHFLCRGVFGITLIFNDMFDKMYSPLSSEEEKQIVSLSVNSIRMRQNMDAILSDIDRLPDITDRISLSRSFDIQAFTYMNYIKTAAPRTSAHGYRRSALF